MIVIRMYGLMEASTMADEAACCYVLSETRAGDVRPVVKLHQRWGIVYSCGCIVILMCVLAAGGGV
jgi:hypothetical protein